MFKFVEARVDSFDRKRKYTACDSCRRKKKRCKHGSETDQPPPQDSSPPENPTLGQTSMPPSKVPVSNIGAENTPLQTQDDVHQSTRLRPDSALHSHASDGAAQRVEIKNYFWNGSMTSGTGQLGDSRFIGDMNPEGLFLEATSPEDLRGSMEGGVGIWLAQRLGASERLSGQSRIAPPSSLFHGYNWAVQQVFQPVLEQDCLSTLPPHPQRKALCTIYFESIHPILPIINRDAFESMHDHNSSRVLIEQALCLVASLNFSSKPHLVFPDWDSPLSVREFGKRLLAAMRVAIEVGVVTDKIVLIQVLILMSFWVDGRQGSENSSLLVGRAVHYVHSLGLHIQDRDDEPQRAYKGTLFCCVWAVDKMNAAFQGIPVFMHERDIDRSLQSSFETQAPAFKLLLHVVALLDRVIALYRPGSTDDELSADFDVFEELIMKCDASQVSSRFLATIEILYHAVAILSCRPRPNNSRNYSSASARIRQALSIDKVTAIVGHEFRDRLALFPFVPYAISLSLSANYREMRRSKIAMFRSRAKIAFEANCRILERLGEMFWSAAAMAEMGNLTLKELDRVYTQVVDGNPRKSQETSGDVQAKDSLDHAKSSLAQPNNTLDPTPNTMFIPDGSAFSFGNLPDLDPFEMFDPSFNLDGLDACLEGNLDLAMPLNLY